MKDDLSWQHIEGFKRFLQAAYRFESEDFRSFTSRVLAILAGCLWWRCPRSWGPNRLLWSLCLTDVFVSNRHLSDIEPHDSKWLLSYQRKRQKEQPASFRICAMYAMNCYDLHVVLPLPHSVVLIEELFCGFSVFCARLNLQLLMESDAFICTWTSNWCLPEGSARQFF